jgi:hypothetical protein
MEWISKIDRIVCLNLLKRTDRLISFTEMMEEYEIPFERYSAIEDEKGAEGLKRTMIELFSDCIEKKLEYVLVFEDDAVFVPQKQIVHETMDKAMSNLPGNMNMLFLGCQLTGRISHFHSPNILQASKMFSTHAVLYTLKGMKEVLASGIYAPIDNYYVEKIENWGGSYCTYPLLCSQRAGFSDIGKSEISWDVFITPRFNQKVNEFNGGWRIR